jgi:hypothetical protein
VFEKVICRVLIVLMAAGLLYVLLSPVVRKSEALWPLTIVLTIGIASNSLYLWLRDRQMLGFLSRHWMLRTLVILWVLFLPQVYVSGLEWFDFIAHDHPVFRTAVSLAEGSEVAKRDLGSPIEIGWSTAGSFGETKDHGDLDLEVPISGSHGAGKMRVIGTKTDGVWKIDELTLRLTDSGVRESLLRDKQDHPGAHSE